MSHTSNDTASPGYIASNAKGNMNYLGHDEDEEARPVHPAPGLQTQQ